LQGRNRRHAGLPIARHGRISAVPRTDFHPFSHPENDMVLVTRRFLLGALPSTIVLATLPALRALAATPGLTTHMLDTMNGIPAEGVRIDFSVLEAEVYRLIATMRTNADGRTPVPLLNAETMKAGRYQLLFYVAEYFAKRGVVLPDPPFVDRAVIQFGITDAAAHYHVPLLASPWSYTTYRGS
jgi:5-hydroxyisourate hydrolase